MSARVVRIDRLHPEPALEEAARVIRSGGLVAYPTESYYALGTDALNAEAVGRVFRAKRRGDDNPVPVIVCDAEALMDIVRDVPANAAEAVERLTPGPVTLVLEAAGGVPDPVTGGTGRVGVRVPDDEFMRVLARMAGGPVTATSANLSGEPGLTDPDEVMRMLGEKIDLLLDGGATPGPPPSTVLDLCVWPPAIMREGRLKRDEIRRVLGI